MSRLSSRFDPVPGSHRPRPRALGIAALLVLAALLVISVTQGIPFVGPAGELVEVEVADAGQLVPGRTSVRVNGVEVGKVEAVEHSGTSGRATLRLRIADDGVDVKRDASVRLRYRAILGGNRFVDLRPGSPYARELGEATIPLGQTSSQVGWEDFNEPFDGVTRAAQRRMLGGLRRALAAPRQIGRTLAVMGSSLAEAGLAAQALRGQRPGELPEMVRASASTLAPLARQRAALRALVRGADLAFAATAANRQDLGRAVALTPSALESTEVTSRRLVPTLSRIDALVSDLRPGARRLGPAMRKLRPGLANADRMLSKVGPLLREARPALTELARMSDEGAPLVEGLRAPARQLDEKVLPMLRRRDPATGLRTYAAIGPTAAAANGWGVGFDRHGHFLNFSSGTAADSVVIPCGPDLDPAETKRCTIVHDLVDALFGGSK